MLPWLVAILNGRSLWICRNLCPQTTFHILISPVACLISRFFQAQADVCTGAASSEQADLCSPSHLWQAWWSCVLLRPQWASCSEKQPSPLGDLNLVSGFPLMGQCQGSSFMVPLGKDCLRHSRFPHTAASA